MIRRTFPGVYEGWIVAGTAGFLSMTVAAVFFYGFGALFNPIREEFGWSVAVTSLAFSLRAEAQGTAAPVVGMAIDRFGPRRVLVAGVAISAAGVVLLSVMAELWQFYATMLVLSVGMGAVGGQVGITATATWFRRRRARAIGLVILGPGFAGVFVVGVAALVEGLGWRSALRVLGAIFVAVGVLAALQVRSRPRDHPQPLDGLPAAENDDDTGAVGVEWGVPLREAWRTRGFLLSSIGQGATFFASTAVIVHQIPYLESLGVSPAAAAGSVAAFTLGSIAGRVGFALLADRYDKRMLLAVAGAIVVAGMPILATSDGLWQAAVAVGIVGAGVGGTLPTRPALLADYFGTRHFGAILGLGMTLLTVGAVISPWVVGWLVDRTGEYTLGWVVCGVVATFAIPLMLLASPPSALTERHRLGVLAGEPPSPREPATAGEGER